MEQEYLFANLPQEIAIDILSRLPFPTIMKCKCVCKAWRHLLLTREFVDYHYSKSLPGLIVSKEAGKETSRRYEILEFVDSGPRPFKTVCDFGVPHRATLESSANGLLLLLNYKNENMLVCNPLTREYINLPPPSESPPFRYRNYGFGVSKMSGEYKVVWISVCESSYKFEVYTLGTGTWRSVAVDDDAALAHYRWCVFKDGKLYSLVNESCMMSCFDLETELLSTVSCPSSRNYKTRLCALGGRLCLCLSDFYEVVIWVMDEVGQWRKEFVICKPKIFDGYWRDTFSAIKILGDGDILLLREGVWDLYYYSRKCETIESISFTSRNRRHLHRVGYSYTPSFLSLKTFAIENVCNF